MSNFTTATSEATASTISPEDLLLPFNEAAMIIVAILIAVMFLFGVVANTITIVVIAQSSRLKSVFSLFIMSLCFSDLGSALVSPFFLYRRTWGFRLWEIPVFFCKLSWCIHMWTNYVTSIHIVCFAALRLYAIAKPVKFKEISNKHARISIVVIWFVTFLVGGIPLFVWCGVRGDGIIAKSPSCGVERQWLKNFRIYTYICYPIFFYFPIILITALSIAILVKFVQRRKAKAEKELNSPGQSGRNSTSKSMTIESISGSKPRKQSKAKQERTAVLQLVLIVVSFFIGYLPFTIYQLISYGEKSENDDTYEHRKYDWTFGIVEYMFLRFSECLNPVFYNLASLTMRTETMTFLRGVWRCCSRR